SPLNTIYWLNLHLQQSRQLDLLEFNTWNKPRLQGLALWPWSKDSMRELFKARSLCAGFPPGIFSFHSLRAGFICSALLKSGSDAEALKSVLENTSFVAGWKPNHPAQLRYVKTCARKTIVSSRLVMPLEENASTNPVDPFLTSSETFHNILL